MSMNMNFSDTFNSNTLKNVATVTNTMRDKCTLFNNVNEKYGRTPVKVSIPDDDTVNHIRQLLYFDQKNRVQKKDGTFQNGKYEIDTQMKVKNLKTDKYVKVPTKTYKIRQQGADTASVAFGNNYEYSPLDYIDPNVYIAKSTAYYSRIFPVNQSINLTTQNYRVNFVNYNYSSFPNATGLASTAANAENASSVSLLSQAFKFATHLFALSFNISAIPEMQYNVIYSRSMQEILMEGVLQEYELAKDRLMILGDSSISATGMVNSLLITNRAPVAATGTGGSTFWSTKTVQLIFDDIAEALTSLFTAMGGCDINGGYPDTLVLGMSDFMDLQSRVLTVDGSGGDTMSIAGAIDLLRKNLMRRSVPGVNEKFEIIAVKDELVFDSVSGTRSFFLYKRDPDVVNAVSAPLVVYENVANQMNRIVTVVGSIADLVTIRPAAICIRTGVGQ